MVDIHGLLPIEQGRPLKRAKLLRKGGIEFNKVMETLPDGPTSVEGLLEWPSYVLRQIVGSEERKARLFHCLGRGLEVTSAYSGMDCPREVLVQICEIMRTKYKTYVPLSFIHACDLAPGPQKCLTWLARHIDGGRSCVFGNLEDRLGEECLNHLDSLSPPAEAYPADKAAAYHAMFKYLCENRGTLFQKLATSWCLVHHRQCRLLSESCLHDEFDSQEVDSINSAPLHHPLRIHFAGTVCKGWSNCGSRAYFAHESERVHSVWLSERMERASQGVEDLFIQECVPAYPIWKLREPLAESHHVLKVVTGPELQGWPTSRPRSFTAALNRERPGLG